MTTPLSVIDWVIIVAIVPVYLFPPLIIVILAIASAYVIYKWYRAGRPITPT